MVPDLLQDNKTSVREKGRGQRDGGTGSEKEAEWT